jgi:hypothetical protein
MKSLDNPLEEVAMRDMKSKYSFILLLAFEGAIKTQNWTSLKSIIQVMSLFRIDVGCNWRTMFFKSFGGYGRSHP